MCLRTLLSLCLWAATGCSRILDFDDVIQACDELRCLPGYSCLPHGPTPGCIRDASLRHFDACFAGQQCGEGLACIAARCRRPCKDAAAVYAEAACEPGLVCRPLGDGFAEVACEPGDPCILGAACAAPEVPEGGVCVAIGASARACLRTCDAQAPSCRDAERCVAVGMAVARADVCVPTALHAAD